MLTAIGAHTFFVGFQRGVERVARVLGSAESWQRGIRARAACGAGHLTFREASRLRADLVFSNPPCSRYSSMSTGHFTDDQRSRLVDFCELGEAHALALEVGARALWWETGPLLWSKGRAMVEDVHRAVERSWGPSTTVVLRLDLRYAGVPQRRPRCHVLHVRGLLEPPAPPPGGLPEGLRVREWVRERAPVRTGYIRGRGPARLEAMVDQACGTFASSRPSIVRWDSPWAPAVLSARQFAWDEPDEWWSTEEYAALMCYPQEDVAPVLAEAGPREAKTLLSKSVSPSAAEWAWRSAWAATLDTPGRGGTWWLDCSHPDGRSALLDPWRKPVASSAFDRWGRRD